MNLAIHWRPLVVMLLMAATAVAAVMAKPTRRVAETGPAIDLETMVPRSFSGWSEDTSIIPLQPSPAVQAVLDRTYDQTLARTYRDARGNRMMLSIAYGGTQDDSMNYHRPEVCYPAQGFRVIRAPFNGSVPLAGGAELPVKRMVAGQGSRNEPITYWLVVGDQLTSFGVQQRLTTLKYGLTGRIPDGMLIRVSSIDRNNESAFEMQQGFILDMLAAVSGEDRTRMLGSLAH
jgi:EpsI family protein